MPEPTATSLPSGCRRSDWTLASLPENEVATMPPEPNVVSSEPGPDIRRRPSRASTAGRRERHRARDGRPAWAGWGAKGADMVGPRILGDEVEEVGDTAGRGRTERPAGGVRGGLRGGGGSRGRGLGPPAGGF